MLFLKDELCPSASLSADMQSPKRLKSDCSHSKMGAEIKSLRNEASHCSSQLQAPGPHMPMYG